MPENAVRAVWPWLCTLHTPKSAALLQAGRLGKGGSGGAQVAVDSLTNPPPDRIEPGSGGEGHCPLEAIHEREMPSSSMNFPPAPPLDSEIFVCAKITQKGCLEFLKRASQA